MQNIEATKQGYADAIQGTPWKNSPVTFDEWNACPVDTMELAAYWKGFDAGLYDIIAKAS